MSRRKLRLVGAFLAVAILVTSAWTVAATAQDTQDKAGKPSALHELFVKKLAEALGVDEKQLAQAMTSAWQQVLDEAPKQGIPLRGGRGRAGGGERRRVLRSSHGSRFLAGFPAGCCRPPNMEACRSRQALREGKTLAELLRERGVSAEEFKARVLKKVEERLDRALSGENTSGQSEKAPLASAGFAHPFAFSSGGAGGRPAGRVLWAAGLFSEG